MKTVNYEIGMVIKSFDFPNKDSSFIIGKITAVDDDYIYCNTISQTCFGDVVVGAELPKTFRTVKQGCMMDDEDFQRIVILEQ